MRVFKREKRKSKKNFENCSGCVYNIKILCIKILFKMSAYYYA